jgi:hypothetical protein
VVGVHVELRRRQTERTVGHRLIDQGHHRLDLGRGRRPLAGIVAHHVPADRGVAAVGRDVHADAAVEPAEEVADAAAGEVDPGVERVGRHALHLGEHLDQPRQVGRLRRGQGEAAVPRQHGGDAVPRRRRCGWFEVQLGVVVRVHIDEARHGGEAVGVDHPGRARGSAELADAGDRAVAHLDVGGERGQAGAVDDAGTADQQVGWLGHRVLAPSSLRADDRLVAALLGPVTIVPSLRSVIRRLLRGHPRRRAG